LKAIIPAARHQSTLGVAVGRGWAFYRWLQPSAGAKRLFACRKKKCPASSRAFRLMQAA